MDYEDFTIDICSANNRGFKATLATPTTATAPTLFRAPIKKRDLQDVLEAFDRPGDQIGRVRPIPEVSPRGHGEILYSTLFADRQIEDLFRQRRTEASRHGRSGLRLRLRFRLDDPALGYLAALPWEWLCDPRTGQFLATDLCTPVVRDLEDAEPCAPPPPTSRLRILVVDAAPRDMKKLLLKLEIERMAEALSLLIDAGRVELLQFPHATPEKLRDVLLDQEIHILHFMGHGGYDSKSGNGAVFFTKPDGTTDPVNGDMLATLLKTIPTLRLVVLNACKTARHQSWTGGPLNYGAAAAVVARTEVPAVIANQYSISDRTSIAFSETFYGRLAAGYAVDMALTEARLRLRGRTSEWATPVLFLSAPDGKLFDFEPVRQDHGIRIVTPDSLRNEMEPVRLGVRSIEGWGRDMEARNEAVLELGQYFEDRYIKKKSDWQGKVFPELRAFLYENIKERRPLLLDFAAHFSIAFAAGWLLEPKSGLDVRVRQRIGSEGEFEWQPADGKEPEGPLWLDRPDIEINPKAPDVAVALSVSQPDVAEHVRKLIRNKRLPVGRIVDAVIAPEPGPRSVLGGAHALRLAHSLIPRARCKHPHELGGKVHFFCAAPNALVFYLGQLASSLERTVLYEFPFRAPGAYGRYQKSIELPPPHEVKSIPPRF